MRLVEAQVRLFQNIVDSTPVEIERDVTCLVGKNESGKTAFLQALYRLNPAYESEADFDLVQNYPRWRLANDRRTGDTEKAMPIQATFALERADIAAVEGETGALLPADTRLRAERNYKRELTVRVEADEAKALKALVEGSDLAADDKQEAIECDSFDRLLALVKAKTPRKSGDGEIDPARLEALKKLQTDAAKAAKTFQEETLKKINEILLKRLPKFFYFGDYNNLPGRINLTDLLSVERKDLDPEQRTARALLDLADVKGKEFLADDFENRVAELEAAANGITQEVFTYWTQNQDLRVNLMADKETVDVPQGKQAVVRYLDVRLNDLRHQVSTNFEQRSTGFRWFFSFVAAFTEFRDLEDHVVVLLDEPGLGLHGHAQADFLRFIDERLAQKHQVLYTTHSPFLIQTSKLERVRVVEDRTTREDPSIGSKVSRDPLSTDPDTVFPLQAALGYDIAQNLFVGEHNVVIEGTSDLVYLVTLSEHLLSLNRTGLDPKWRLTPVGGIDKIPTFVALLGSHLNVTVLMDASTKGIQRLTDMATKGLLEQRRLITIGQILGTKEADIEDLFATKEYLQLFNAAFGKNVTEGQLVGTDPIVKRLGRTNGGGDFDHGLPATELLKSKVTFLPGLQPETLARFEKLFEAVNATLPTAP